MDERERRERCLVTGGAGYLGRALSERLSRAGHWVRTFDLLPEGGGPRGVEHLQGDLRDYAAVRAAVEGVDVVFHTAAIINLLGVARAADRRRVMDVNVGGARHVVRACREAGVGRLVYTSTNNVAFDRTIVGGDEREPYAETFVDLYTESKVASEKIVLAADDPAGLRTIALRPGGIWGPGPGAIMLEKFIAQLAAGRLVATIGSGRAVADNTHVDNLVHAELLAARALRDKPEVVGGQAYYITDGEPMNPMEWFRPLAQDLGYSMPRLRLPSRAMYSVAWAMEWLHRFGGPPPQLTRMEVLKVSRSHSFRIDNARRDLGYEPLRTRVEGLKECVPYARELLARSARRAG